MGLIKIGCMGRGAGKCGCTEEAESGPIHVGIKSCMGGVGGVISISAIAGDVMTIGCMGVIGVSTISGGVMTIGCIGCTGVISISTMPRERRGG